MFRVEIANMLGALEKNYRNWGISTPFCSLTKELTLDFTFPFKNNSTSLKQSSVKISGKMLHHNLHIGAMIKIV